MSSNQTKPVAAASGAKPVAKANAAPANATKKPATDLTNFLKDPTGVVADLTSHATEVKKDATLYLTAIGTSYASGAQSGSVLTGLGKIASFIIGIILIIVVLSLLIHYFITPVYSLRPGTPGIISVPGFDDGKLFWSPSSTYPGVSTIPNKDLPITNSYYDYSLIVDVFIQNPMQFSTHPRIILSRGAIMNSTKTGNTLLGLASKYNLIVALSADTTDITVSVLNQHNQSENIIVENAPVQQPFRLGIIVMQQAMEVYINGKLLKTRKYTTSLMDVKGDIRPASGIELNIAMLQNLKVWQRVLQSPEIQYAKPEMATAASFGAGPIPPSSSCEKVTP